MQKITYNAALVLLLSLGVSACSINAGKGSQGESTVRASSLNATTNNSLQTSDENTSESTSNNASQISDENTSANTSNNVSQTSDENTSESTNDNSSQPSDENASENTNNNSSQTNDENNSENTDTNREQSSETEKTLLENVAGYAVSGSYAEKYLTDLTAKEELLIAVTQSSNIPSGSCSASGGSNAANHPCSVGVAKEGSIIGGYSLKEGEQTLGAYAIIREAYSDGVNPTNSYVAIIDSPTTNRSAVVNATYSGSASYSTNNRPNMVTRDFELNVTDNGVDGSIYYIAGSGKRTTAVTFHQGSISEQDGKIGFDGKVSFNNSVVYGLGDTEGSYQGWFVGENAQGVIGTFSTTSQSSTNSVQGAFAGQK